MNEVYSFEVRVAGTDWTRIINARTRGAAKSQYHREVSDPWPDIPYTAIGCRKLGAPVTTRGFEQNASYRGMPGLRCGQPVKVGEQGKGTIVGHNSSANFDVLFDEDSPRYAGLTLNVHPSEITILSGPKGGQEA